jgi:hypothetical protein
MHNWCGSSWIIAQCQMKGIHILFIHFSDILALNYTTLEWGKEVEKSNRWSFPYEKSVVSWAEHCTKHKPPEKFDLWRHPNTSTKNEAHNRDCKKLLVHLDYCTFASEVTG